jgi:hypothetical protein
MMTFRLSINVNNFETGRADERPASRVLLWQWGLGKHATLSSTLLRG